MTKTTKYQNDPKTFDDLRKAGIRFVRKLTAYEDIVEEVVGETIVKCLEKSCDVPNWAYFRQALINNFRQQHRDRNGEVSVDFSAVGSHEIVGVTQPTQDITLILAEIGDALERLPTKTTACLNLAAVGFETEEIAHQVGIEIKEVYWRLRSGRQVLREKGYWNDEREYKQKLVGIRRFCHRWEARIVVNGKRLHLGMHASASEAAKAYQDAVDLYYGGTPVEGRKGHKRKKAA